MGECRVWLPPWTPTRHSLHPPLSFRAIYTPVGFQSAIGILVVTLPVCTISHRIPPCTHLEHPFATNCAIAASRSLASRLRPHRCAYCCLIPWSRSNGAGPAPDVLPLEQCRRRLCAISASANMPLVSASCSASSFSGRLPTSSLKSAAAQYLSPGCDLTKPSNLLEPV